MVHKLPIFMLTSKYYYVFCISGFHIGWFLYTYTYKIYLYFYVARLFLKYVEILQQIENNIRVKQSFDASEENTAWRQEKKNWRWKKTPKDVKPFQNIPELWNTSSYRNLCKYIFHTYHPKPTHLKKFFKKMKFCCCLCDTDLLRELKRPRC